MAERVYLLFEIITILIGLRALHRGNKRPGIATMVYVALSLIIAFVIEAGWIHGAFVNLIYLGLIIVCKLEYGDKIFDAVVYVVMDIALLGALQMMGGVIVCGILRENYITNEITLGIMLFTGGILLVIYKYLKLNKYVEIVFLNGIVGKIVLLFGSLAGIFIFSIMKSDNSVSWKSVIGLPVLIIIISIILFQWQKEKFQNRQKEQELLAYERYNLVYKDL